MEKEQDKTTPDRSTQILEGKNVDEATSLAVQIRECEGRRKQSELQAQSIKFGEGDQMSRFLREMEAGNSEEQLEEEAQSRKSLECNEGDSMSNWAEEKKRMELKIRELEGELEEARGRNEVSAQKAARATAERERLAIELNNERLITVRRLDSLVRVSPTPIKIFIQNIARNLVRTRASTRDIQVILSANDAVSLKHIDGGAPCAIFPTSDSVVKERLLKQGSYLSTCLLATKEISAFGIVPKEPFSMFFFNVGVHMAGDQFRFHRGHVNIYPGTTLSDLRFIVPGEDLITAAFDRQPDRRSDSTEMYCGSILCGKDDPRTNDFYLRVAYQHERVD